MKRFALGPVVTMMALLLLCIQTNSPIANAAEEQVIRLKFSNVFPAPHRVGMLHQQWCRDVEKATNGRVKFSYFPGGTLAACPDVRFRRERYLGCGCKCFRLYPRKISTD